jgi:S-adenosylmethionine decarboxylase
MTNPTPNPFEEQHQPPINAPGTTSSVLFDTSPGPFEGPEKLLEIWFAPSPQQLPKVTRKLGDGLEYRAKRKSKVVGQEAQEEEREWKGLRRVKREIWEDMLRVVKCQVLSVIEGEEVDAYLLR